MIEVFSDFALRMQVYFPIIALNVCMHRFHYWFIYFHLFLFYFILFFLFAFSSFINFFIVFWIWLWFVTTFVLYTSYTREW